jgi:copper chaperone CopZ
MGDPMAVVSFKVSNIQCYDCVLALRKFLGSLDGIQSIEMDGEDKIDISYDTSSFSEGRLTQVVYQSVDKLGFKIEKL